VDLINKLLKEENLGFGKLIETNEDILVANTHLAYVLLEEFQRVKQYAAKHHYKVYIYNDELVRLKKGLYSIHTRSWLLVDDDYISIEDIKNKKYNIDEIIMSNRNRCYKLIPIDYYKLLKEDFSKAGYKELGQSITILNTIHQIDTLIALMKYDYKGRDMLFIVENLVDDDKFICNDKFKYIITPLLKVKA